MSAAPIELNKALMLSLTGLGRLFRCSREVMRARLSVAGVRPAAGTDSRPLYLLDEVIAAWLSSERRSRDPDDLVPLERRAYYQGEIEKLALQVKRGEVIPRAEVERVFARAYGTVAQYLDTITDVVERSTASTPEQLRRLDVGIAKLREDLYEALVSDPDDADGTARKRA